MPLRKLAIILVGVLAASTSANAAECQNNRFNPSFVRHDSVAPTVWYVEPGGGFTPMSTPAEAQSTCRTRGVRERIGGQTCRRRNWGDFACGCNITPSPNRTCAAFQDFLRTIGINPGITPDRFCQELYARGDTENRAGNRARARGNLEAARAAYQRAAALFQQGVNDSRCIRFQPQFTNAVAIVQRNLQRIANDSTNAFCDRYARVAIAQNQENVRRRCGYTGGRWQSIYNNHYRWCRGTSRNAANYERRQRSEALKRCRARTPSGGRNTFCDRYARTAVAQNQENARRNCGFTGPRWQSHYNNHYGWCVRVSKGTANYEETQRINGLNRCRAR